MTTSEPSLLTMLCRQRIAQAVLLAVVLLATVNWILTPEKALRWLRIMLTLPAIWLAITWWGHASLASVRQRGVEDVSGIVRYFLSAVALTVFSIGLWEIVRLGLELWVATGHDHGDHEIERRILGLASSAMFVVIGNVLPKILTPLTMLSRERAALVTVARRFVGTIFVVVGLVTAYAYVTAPLTFAKTLMLWATGICVLTTFGAIIWMNVRASRLET